MFAFILWLTLGWRAGAAELVAEIVIGLMLFGGGGRQARRTLGLFGRRMLRRPALSPA